jgi:sterol desaturase/sphingolipid hydroxylase (fatty acid hydroxylase superfamily)
MRAGAAAALVDRVVRSPLHYWFAMVVDVVAALGFLALGVWLSAGPFPAAAAAAAGGFFAWGFFEYVLHRWILHGPPSIARVNHAYHHADPSVLIGTPVFVILIGATAIWMLLSLAMPAGLAAVAVSGLYSGYNSFAIVHHIGHHYSGRLAQLRIVGRLEQFHDAHHARQNVNFGITTTLWDRLFGTYEEDLGGHARGRPRV